MEEAENAEEVEEVEKADTGAGAHVLDGEDTDSDYEDDIFQSGTESSFPHSPPPRNPTHTT